MNLPDLESNSLATHPTQLEIAIECGQFSQEQLLSLHHEVSFDGERLHALCFRAQIACLLVQGDSNLRTCTTSVFRRDSSIKASHESACLAGALP